MVAFLVVKFLAITLLCLPTAVVDGDRTAHAVQMGISSAVVIFILLVPLALVTQDCQAIVTALNECRTIGRDAFTGFVEPDTDARITTMLRYLQDLNKG
jgi:hypothetical protein